MIVCISNVYQVLNYHYPSSSQPFSSCRRCVCREAFASAVARLQAAAEAAPPAGPAARRAVGVMGFGWENYGKLWKTMENH